jgi:hypothetical protein
MADYEIRDVMNRLRHPRLSFRIRLAISSSATTQLSVRVQNESPVMAHHYMVRVLLPPVLGGNKCCPEKPVVDEHEGFRFWRISLRGGIDRPIFPCSDEIRQEELPSVWDNRTMPQPVADYMYCTLFADDMPFSERRVSVADALEGWA